LYVLILDRGAPPGIHPHRRVTNQCEMPVRKGSKIFNKFFEPFSCPIAPYLV